MNEYVEEKNDIADKMLENAGYYKNKKQYNDNWIIYEKTLQGLIIFDLIFKNVVCEMTITPYLHLAIHEKMKELGWISDDIQK